MLKTNPDPGLRSDKKNKFTYGYIYIPMNRKIPITGTFFFPNNDMNPLMEKMQIR